MSQSRGFSQDHRPLSGQHPERIYPNLSHDAVQEFHVRLASLRADKVVVGLRRQSDKLCELALVQLERNPDALNPFDDVRKSLHGISLQVVEAAPGPCVHPRSRQNSVDKFLVLFFGYLLMAGPASISGPSAPH